MEDVKARILFFILGRRIYRIGGKFSITKLRFSQSYMTMVTGRFKNTSTLDDSWVEIGIPLFDIDDNCIGMAYTYGASVGPGDVWEFEAPVRSDLADIVFTYGCPRVRVS